jgi:quercetin dioxygenase-like cupin family protein
MRLQQGFKVLAGEDRLGASIRFLNGRFDLKVSARDTGGAWCAFDTFRTQPGGPPRHVHLAQDEWFLVMAGRFRFEVGAETFEAESGDTVFGPRGVPHAFRNITDTARLVVLFQPALTMEEFFSSGMLDPASPEFAELSRAHGMEVVGPPLT